MNKTSFKRIFLIILCAFISCLAIIIDLNKDLELLKSFHCDTITFVIVLCGTAFLNYSISTFSSKYEKREKIVSAVLAIIYSTIDVIGFTYNEYKESIFETSYLIKLFIRFLGLYFIFYKFGN